MTAEQRTFSNEERGARIKELIWCFASASKLHEVTIDVRQIERVIQCAPEHAEIELIRAAAAMGVKLKRVKTKYAAIERVSLPIIAVMSNGGYALFLNAEGGNTLYIKPGQQRPSAASEEELAKIWSGEALFFKKKLTFENIDREFNIKWFIPVIIKFRKLFSEVAAASFFLQLFGLAMPLFSQVIIDKVLLHKGYSTLDVLVIGIVILSAFEFFVEILRTYIFSHTTSRVDVILGAKLFRHLVSLPLAYFETHRVGTTIARVRELENIRQFITSSAMTVLLDIFFGTVYVVFMYLYSPGLTFIALAALPFLITLSVFVTPVLRARLKERFHAGAEQQSFLVESVTGIQTVKSLALETQMNSLWESQLSYYVKTSFRSGFLAAAAGSGARLIQKVSSLAILWFGARMVMDGRLTVGQLIAFQMLAGRMSEPVIRLASLWQNFQQARLSIERLGDVLNTKPEAVYSPSRISLPCVRGGVTFEHLYFRYRVDTPPVVDDFSLRVKEGTSIGIVGRSGSGKSTLAKLLQRMYLPERGRILIDGVDLTQMDPSWLRKQIGVVLQENFLFDGSIRDNIAITSPGAQMSEVMKATELAGADEFIREFPEGYDTQVGERGTALSGGQRQRIAIARALLTDPKILIFDEATSALDYHSERIIQRNLNKIRGGRTMFIIAHRLSTVRNTDAIIVMDRGRMIEKGTHDELMRMKGEYYGLYMQQESGALQL